MITPLSAFLLYQNKNVEEMKNVFESIVLTALTSIDEKNAEYATNILSTINKDFNEFSSKNVFLLNQICEILYSLDEQFEIHIKNLEAVLFRLIETTNGNYLTIPQISEVISKNLFNIVKNPLLDHFTNILLSDYCDLIQIQNIPKEIIKDSTDLYDKIDVIDNLIKILKKESSKYPKHLFLSLLDFTYQNAFDKDNSIIFRTKCLELMYLTKKNIPESNFFFADKFVAQPLEIDKKEKQSIISFILLLEPTLVNECFRMLESFDSLNLIGRSVVQVCKEMDNSLFYRFINSEFRWKLLIDVFQRNKLNQAAFELIQLAIDRNAVDNFIWSDFINNVFIPFTISNNHRDKLYMNSQFLNSPMSAFQKKQEDLSKIDYTNFLI